MPFSFLHCADLHLGCAQYNLAERYADFFASFEAIAQLAEEKSVQAVLIAGDLFHHRSIDAQTLLRACEILKTLRDMGIAVVSVEGNHDKAYYLERQSWQEYLCAQGLVTLLKPDNEPSWALREYDGKTGAVLEMAECRIVGMGYLGGSTRQRLEELAVTLGESEKPTIALLHAAVNKLMGQDMAGISVEALEPYTGKVDYFAMGHVHARSEVLDWAFTPGAPECVHIDEGKRGEKGCYYVQVEKKNENVIKRVEFIPLPRRNTLFLQVDLTDTALDWVSAKVLRDARETFPKDEATGALLSVLLCGQPRFSVSSLDVRALEEAVRDELGCLFVEIGNDTVGTDASGQGGSLDRDALEQSVLRELAQEAGAMDPQAVAQVAAALKKALLNGEAPAAMLDFLCVEEVE